MGVKDGFGAHARAFSIAKVALLEGDYPSRLQLGSLTVDGTVLAMFSGRICHNRLCFALRCPHSPRTSGSGSRRVRCCSSARSRRPQLKGIAFYDIGVGMARA
jgi:hypothetical protein